MQITTRINKLENLRRSPLAFCGGDPRDLDFRRCTAIRVNRIIAWTNASARNKSQKNALISHNNIFPNSTIISQFLARRRLGDLKIHNLPLVTQANGILTFKDKRSHYRQQNFKRLLDIVASFSLLHFAEFN